MQGISIVKIAAAINMEPKNARAKARRLKIPTKYLVSRKRNGRTEWLVRSEHVKWFKQQLKNDGRRNG